MICYQFPARPGYHFGFNIFALLHESESQATLIDTAYQEHAAAVLADLTAQGYTIQQVILSHFHDDHADGLRALPEVPIWGSPRYQETLDLYGTPGDVEVYAPQHLLTDDTELTVGPFNLQFRLVPGHAPCNAFTIINGQFIHVADEIMFSNAGESILPWIESTRIAEHIHSLEFLHAYESYTMLLGHGPAISGAATIRAAIDDRISYLRAVLESPTPIAYEDAVADCTCTFLHSEWHADISGN